MFDAERFGDMRQGTHNLPRLTLHARVDSAASPWAKATSTLRMQSVRPRV